MGGEGTAIGGPSGLLKMGVQDMRRAQKGIDVRRFWGVNPTFYSTHLPSIHLSIHAHIHLSIHLSTHPSIPHPSSTLPFVHPAVHSPTHSSTTISHPQALLCGHHLPIPPPIFAPLCLPVHPPSFLSVCLPTHLIFIACLLFIPGGQL